MANNLLWQRGCGENIGNLNRFLQGFHLQKTAWREALATAIGWLVPAFAPLVQALLASGNYLLHLQNRKKTAQEPCDQHP
jgi:hypothetical protein